MVIVGLAVLIIIVDIALVLLGISTISFVLYSWARAYPVVSFALGFVMGHIFWPVETSDDARR